MPDRRFTFSKTTITDLPPAEPGRRICYYDDKLDGLELRITDTGSKSFSVNRWINGKACRIVLGRYNPDAVQTADFEKNPLSVLANNPGLTIEHARKLGAAVISQLTLGINPLKSRRATGGMTLGEVFHEYLHGYAIDHTKTWKVMEECFDRYLGEWRNRPVGTITRADVQLLVNKLGRENGKTTANRTLELLRAIINKGKQWGLVQGENPCLGVSKFKLQPRARFVVDEELPALFKAIDEEQDEDIRDYVRLSLYTGARKSNILSMRWEHVDLGKATWVIPDTKNGTSQTILLTENELGILRRRFDDRARRKNFEFVFPGTGASGHLADPKKGWKRILKAAGIEDLHLHDLRRTLGSYMAMTGASLSVIGNALNHKDVSTTRKVYAHSAREAERKAREIAHQKMFDSSKEQAKQPAPLRQKQDRIEF